MYTFFQNVLIGLILICSIQAKLIIEDDCSSDPFACPENSECRPLSCLGYHCTCNEGFMPTENKTECIKGAALTENCYSTLPCLNANSVCTEPLISLSPPTCQCKKGYINTNNLQCLKENGYKRFGQWCEGVCGPTLTCTRGFCQCKSNYRQRTVMEIQVDPDFDEDCIETEFSLSKCRDEPVSRINSTATSMNSTALNADSTYIIPKTNQSTETGNDTSQYDFSQADNQTSNVSLPASIDRSTSTQAPGSRNVITPLATDRPMIPTTTPNAMEMTSSPQNQTLNFNETATFEAISKSQILTKISNLQTVTIPYTTSLDINTSRIQETSTLLTKLQNSATPSQQQSSHPQVTVTTTNTITPTVQIFQTIPLRSTDILPVSSRIPVKSSSPVTTDGTPNPQNQTTVQKLHGLSSSTVSEERTVFSVSGKSEPITKKLSLTTPNPLTAAAVQTTASIAKKTFLPTTEYIPTKTAPQMAGSIPTKTASQTTAFIPTQTDPRMTVSISAQTGAPTIASPATRVVLTTEDLIGQNVTKNLRNESTVTRSPAVRTDRQPRSNAGNRISTEAIVIPSVLVIILAIVITSVIAIVVCKKRRSHISLSTVIDSNTYKLPRASMMSQALTSAPSSPYDHTGSRPSYHYVNEAFENNRL